MEVYQQGILARSSLEHESTQVQELFLGLVTYAPKWQ
jgi:hypothetical protein